jgi:chemotaxis signal transduction protein
MSDELSEFLGETSDEDREQAGATPSVTCDLLVFEHGNDLFAVPASCVDSIVTWKAPAPLPGADPRVLGVIQDRGRIVMLVAHPSGKHAEELPPVEPKRVIICTTPRGYVGMPATTTRAVGCIELSCTPTHSSVCDSELGPLIYLDPTTYPDS